MTFKIYYKLLGGHYHIRVFINGGKSGDLVVAEREWAEFRAHMRSWQFFEDE